MKIYLMALGAGLLVGAIYSLINVRSPAPPVVALVGLLGILVGEQIVPVIREMVAGRSALSYLHLGSRPHIFGSLPHGPAHAAAMVSPVKETGAGASS